MGRSGRRCRPDWITTALLLARAGCSVLVLEAHRVGSGTTGGSTAKLSLLQGTTLSRIARRHKAETVAQYVAANNEAFSWVDRYADEHGVARQERSAYTYATSESGQRAAERELRVAESAGLPVCPGPEPPSFPSTPGVQYACPVNRNSIPSSCCSPSLAMSRPTTEP